eukprot:365520-Chlamydomonas_euryale.AAC.4
MACTSQMCAIQGMPCPHFQAAVGVAPSVPTRQARYGAIVCFNSITGPSSFPTAWSKHGSHAGTW